MVRSAIRRLMAVLFGDHGTQREDRSRSILAEADQTVREERARLARLRPIIDRLPKRDDWQRMYDERFGR
jgi:hypothetical protein